MLMHSIKIKILIGLLFFANLNINYLAWGGEQLKVPADLPTFRSAVRSSVTQDSPGQLNLEAINEYVKTRLTVVSQTPKLLLLTFAATTGDYAYIWSDGQVIIASKKPLDSLVQVKQLESELAKIQGFISDVSVRIVDLFTVLHTKSEYFGESKYRYHRMLLTVESAYGVLRVPKIQVKQAQVRLLGNNLLRLDFAHHSLELLYEGEAIARKSRDRERNVFGKVMINGRAVLSTDKAPKLADITKQMRFGEHELIISSAHYNSALVIETIYSGGEAGPVIVTEDKKEIEAQQSGTVAGLYGHLGITPKDTEEKLAISPQLRAKIMEEARHRCGYCLTQQRAINWLLEVEHIIPSAAGGPDDEANLWIGCTACNRYKGTQTEASDPDTGKRVQLFNPRRQKWAEHFQWSEDGTEIIGLTACGRATIEALKLNNELAKQARAIWRQAGIHPPED
jgi:hypothetical protein